MNLTGDAVLAPEAEEYGLVNERVADEELLDVAISWARKLAGQAPLAVEQIKKVSHKGDLDEGIEAEKEGFADRLPVRGRQGGHLRLPRQAQRASGRASKRPRDQAERLAELIRESARARSP